MSRKFWIQNIATIAMSLAFIVVVLGAYTRLTDAGLGCPDWPGCYGHIIPNTSIEPHKAWTEMIHRYAAGSVGVLILLLFILRPSLITGLLVGLVILQAALGMWTVTLKLLPIVVMAHLLGGMLILGILSYFRMSISDLPAYKLSAWRPWMLIGIGILFLQIALGGWVSANYAGLGCIGFPQCNGVWFPKLSLSQGFYLFSPIGENYQGGVLDHQVRMTIQFIHRLGAYITFAYLLILFVMLIAKVKIKYVQSITMGAILLLILQVALGIINVVYLLPLWAAVAHNAVAALLFITILILYYFINGKTAYQS